MTADSGRILNLLTELDNELYESCYSIEASIDENGIFEDEVFDSSFVLYNENERPKKLIGRKGVYVFEITKDVPLTREQVRLWSERCKGAGFNDWFQGDLKQGDILYIGSCISKSLFVRIREHFLNKTTINSLRLGHPDRHMLYDAVKVYAFPIKKSIPDQYYRYLIPIVEKKLHDELQPKAGSSRV